MVWIGFGDFEYWVTKTVHQVTINFYKKNFNRNHCHDQRHTIYGLNAFKINVKKWRKNVDV